MPSGPGHLFLVQGDLTKMALDDVILPCDSWLQVSPWVAPMLPNVGLTPTAPGLLRVSGVMWPQDFHSAARSPIQVPADGHDSAHGGGRPPRVWLMNSATPDFDVESSISWLAAGLGNALRAVADLDGGAPQRPKPQNERERRVIGVPLFGLGRGGFAPLRPQVMRGLLEVLQSACAAPGAPDVVLVLRSRAEYEAFQSIRDAPALPSGMGKEGASGGSAAKVLDRLAAHTRAGRLVPFIGAGVSASAGMDTWTTLLSSLAEEVGTWPAGLQSAVVELPPEDAAQAVANEIGIDRIRELIRERMDIPRHSMAHALLASLRFREAITTNYDTLYESAFRSAHGKQALKVLPGQPANSDESWLLKLHGDIARPESIVLTRRNYLDFDTDQIPLAAIVQAFMLTKHLVFIGYSVSDQNVIRFVHQVAGIQAEATGSRVGTVLSLLPQPARQVLWRHHLDYVNMLNLAAGDPRDDGEKAQAARNLEIFLDVLAHRACGKSAFLLDPTYRALLDEPGRNLADGLAALAAAHAETAAALPAWHRVKHLLAELGYRG